MKIPLLLLLFALPPPGAAYSPEDPVPAARMESLLADLLGPGKARVFIRWEYLPASPARPSALWSRMAKSLGEPPQVLPGYALPRSLQAKALQAMASSPRRRMVATVILDGAVPEKEGQEALATAAQALGLDASRGDELKVLRAALKAPGPAQETPGGPFPIWPWAAAAGAALAGAGVWFWRRRASAASEEGPSLSLAPAAEIPDIPISAVPWLAAVDLRHAQALADFLAREGADGAAAVLRELRPRLAAEVFRRLPSFLQKGAALALLRVAPQPASEPVSRARSFLAARSAGTGLLEDILLRCPDWVKEGVLAFLESAAPLPARSLRKSVPTWDDLAAADPASLRLALSRFSCDELALCLFDQTAAAPMLEALPAGVAETVRRRLRTRVPASLDQAERQRAAVLTRWKSLAPLTLMLALGWSTAGCAAPPARPRPALSSPARSEGLLRTLRLEDALLSESELLRKDDYSGDADARSALEAYGRKDDLSAMLFAQAALGADPENRSRRTLLRILSTRTGIAPDPEGLLPRGALVQHELTSADRSFFDERFGAAIQSCRRALALDPGRTGAWLRLGSAHLALGEKEQARGAFQEALKLNPKDSELKDFLKGQGWDGK